MKYFNAEWYSNNYPEVKKYKFLKFYHYIKYGWRKGYDPSIYFSTKNYLENRPDVTDMCPLIHYLRFGRKESIFKLATKDTYNGNYKKRYLMFISRYINLMLNYKLIKRNRNKKILVIFHLYYSDSFDEIKYYLDNLQFYDYDLIVTYDEKIVCKETLDKVNEYKPNATLVELDDYGKDIYPFLYVCCNTNLDKYKVIYKICSIGTYHKADYKYKCFFKDRDFFLECYDGILSASNVHKTVDMLCNDGKVGLITSKRTIGIDEDIFSSFAYKKCVEKGIDIEINNMIAFGQCFAIKKSLINIPNYRILLNCDFSQQYEDCYSLYDATYKLISSNVINSGFTITGFNTNLFRKAKWSKVESKLKKLDGMNYYGMIKNNVSDDFILRTLSRSFVKGIEIKNIKLSTLMSFPPFIDAPINILDTIPYKYLITKDVDEYINYCSIGRRSDYLYLSDNDFIEQIEKICVNRYEELFSSIKSKGYDNKSLIVVRKENNQVLDGIHRTCCLLFLEGSECEKEVMMIDLVDLFLHSAKPFTDKLKILRI